MTAESESLFEEMFVQVRKRDGRVVTFDTGKITDAIYKAAQAVGGTNKNIAGDLAGQVVRYLSGSNFSSTIPGVEEVQDAVEKVLIENGHARTAKAYILYRAHRSRIREGKSELMDAVKEILVEDSLKGENNGSSPSAKMLQIAIAASKKYYLANLLPEEFAQAHAQGQVFIHNLGYYSKTAGCFQLNLLQLLKNGFNPGYGYIAPPKRIFSAAVQTAVILQNNQNDMFGGQSFPHFDKSMGAVIRDLPECPGNDEISRAMDGLIFNLNAVHSRSGAQVPFSSINLGTDITDEGRIVSSAILNAFSSSSCYVYPHIIFKVKKGINLNPGDPNYDIFQLAIKAAANCSNVAFSFMDTSFNSPYGEEVSYMGGFHTRTIDNRHGKKVSAGRGSIAVTSINLPRVALETKSADLFIVELDRLMRLAARQLVHRFEILARLRVKDLPFLMGQKLYMGSENLGPNDSIRDALKNGLLGIGFIGLAETLLLLTGYHHGERNEARELGYQILDHMNKRTKQFSEDYDLNFGLYAASSGALSGRFITMDREKFGVIRGITDRSYYTDSYHIPAECPVSSFDRISIEGSFHKYCEAGHVSYAALPPEKNAEDVEKIVRHMAAADIGYAELNCKNLSVLKG